MRLKWKGLKEIVSMVLDTRFELVTTSMSWRHSTAELIEQLVHYKQRNCKHFL